MVDTTSSAGPRPYPEPRYKRALLDAAIDTDGPVSAVDEEDSGPTRVFGLVEDDGEAYLVQIVHRHGAETPTSVRISRSSWRAEVAILRKWTRVELGGGDSIPRWEAVLVAFLAAYKMYLRALTREPPADLIETIKIVG